MELFKKDPAKEKKRKRQQNMSKIVFPEMGHLMKEFAKLDRKEKKIYRRVSKELYEYVSMHHGEPTHKEAIYMVEENSEELDALKEDCLKRRELVKYYLSQHPKIPEKVRDLIWHMQVAESPELYDRIVAGDDKQKKK